MSGSGKFWPPPDIEPEDCAQLYKETVKDIEHSGNIEFLKTISPGDVMKLTVDDTDKTILVLTEDGDYIGRIRNRSLVKCLKVYKYEAIVDQVTYSDSIKSLILVIQR
ncbi:MAG: hypothetical protein QJR05_12265 [Thermoanaerobacterium sp.]|nr:hypothetical protein [Thermoanaerobacterium sp.]